MGHWQVSATPDGGQLQYPVVLSLIHWASSLKQREWPDALEPPFIVMTFYCPLVKLSIPASFVPRERISTAKSKVWQINKEQRLMNSIQILKRTNWFCPERKIPNVYISLSIHSHLFILSWGQYEAITENEISASASEVLQSMIRSKRQSRDPSNKYAVIP